MTDEGVAQSAAAFTLNCCLSANPQPRDCFSDRERCCSIDLWQAQSISVEEYTAGIAESRASANCDEADRNIGRRTKRSRVKSSRHSGKCDECLGPFAF